MLLVVKETNNSGPIEEEATVQRIGLDLLPKSLCPGTQSLQSNTILSAAL